MEAITLYPETKEEMRVIKAFSKVLNVKFEAKKSIEKDNSQFLSKIRESEKQAKNGEYITIKDSKNIWKDILSK